MLKVLISILGVVIAIAGFIISGDIGRKSARFILSKKPDEVAKIIVKEINRELLQKGSVVYKAKERLSKEGLKLEPATVSSDKTGIHCQYNHVLIDGFVFNINKKKKLQELQKFVCTKMKPIINRGIGIKYAYYKDNPRQHITTFTITPKDCRKLRELAGKKDEAYRPQKSLQ